MTSWLDLDLTAPISVENTIDRLENVSRVLTYIKSGLRMP